MITLPAQQQEIAGQEGARVNQLGEPPTRPLEFTPDDPAPEIMIDTGTGVAVAISDDDGFAPASPYIKETRNKPPFGENLAEVLPDHTLGNIGSEVIQGVEADITSRSPWTEQYNKGIDLLGTKIEDVANRTTRRNISRAGHPLMMEAMVKYWAGASGEMLPAAGPVKAPTIGRVSEDEERQANAFEADFNYFFTTIAKEYYPDTRRMLIHQSFCGQGYKKVMRDPIRRRPTSLSINAPDLIVSEEATDLDSALRVTHRIDMLKADLRRFQIIGQYRDVVLGQPGMLSGFGASANRKIKENEGLAMIGFGRPEDQPYEIFEADVTLDIDDHMIDGYYERRTPSGMPLPYKVTVERNSQQVLGIWRNWRPEDDLCLKRNMYVKFGMVPGLGFHDWGFLQLLGNQTRVLRAIWRLLIDAGMFNLFPGGIKNKNARASTNEIAPGPGEWVDIDVPPNIDLRTQFVQNLYKEPSAVLVQMAEIIKQDAMRLGGTVMLEVGEGRTNVPVGTMMSMIEQQVQVMSEVFKGNHNSQKEEFEKIRELFAENPSDLTMLCRKRPRSRDEQVIDWGEKIGEFTNMSLQPASDPNVPSRIHRMMMTNVLVMLAQQNPTAFDTREVYDDALTTIGKDADRFLARQENQAAPPPDPRIAMKQQELEQKDRAAQLQAQEKAADVQVKREQLAAETAQSAADNQTRREVSRLHEQGEMARTVHQAQAEAARQPAVPGVDGRSLPIP